MKKAIGIYLRGGKLIFHPIMNTKSGGRFSEPVFTVNFDDDPSFIGETADKTFSFVGYMEVPETYDKNLLKPLFKAAKVRSYRELTKGALRCIISNDENDLHFESLKNSGPGRGFSFLKEKNFQHTIAEMNNLHDFGETIKKAFENAE
jgi:hypothetical protein